jgi:hypothetical protein
MFSWLMFACAMLAVIAWPRFRFGSQSFQYCYRNLAKWLGLSYFSWRNTNANDEQDVQNVKVNIQQLERVMIAALAAAASKAQKRALLSQYSPDQLVDTGVKSNYSEVVESSAFPGPRPARFKSSSVLRTSTVAGLAAAVLLVLAVILRTVCKLSKRILFFLLLVTMTLTTQAAVNFYHQQHTQQTATKTANVPDGRSILVVTPTATTERASLYEQFLVQYSSMTGACV